MLKFVEAGLRAFVGACLWLILLGSIVGGGIWGENVGISWVFGAVVGACVGALLDIFWGGLFALLLNFVDNVKIIAEGISGINKRMGLLREDIVTLRKSGMTAFGAAVDSPEQTAPSPPMEESCPKCGIRIAPNTEFCIGCGTRL